MAFDFGMLSGIGQLLGGVGGLFGKKANPGRDTRHVILNQVGTAREAGEKYGFNPLTVLQSGAANVGGIGGGGASPLASVQMITDGLRGIDDVVSGDAARRRAADQLNLDLAQLKLDQARSGVVATVPQYAVSGIGSGPSPLGVRPVSVYPSNGQRFGAKNGQALFSASQGDLGDSQGRLRTVPVDRSGNDATRYSVGGFKLEPNPNWSDAEFIEQRHGDVASWLYGLGIIGADLSYNLPKIAEIQFGAKPIEDLPLQDRPPRWMAREWGRIPDVWDAGQPGWFVDGNPNHVTYTPPNKRSQ